MAAEAEAPRRLLIVKTSSMGDVIHALPTLTDLRAQRPDWQIDWMVERPFDAIVRLHPGVTRVLPMTWRKWRKQLWRAPVRAQMADFRRELRATTYDLVLDLQGLVKSALWARQARGELVGYDRASAREGLATLAYQRGAAVSTELHAIERCRRLAAAHLGYTVPAGAPNFGIVAPEPSWMPVGVSAGMAVLVPGASVDSKLWPQADWIAVGRELRARGMAVAVLWGSPAELARAQEIAQGMGGEVPPFLSIADAAAVLGRAQIVVGLDTGFTHLAAALGADTVCLLGAAHDASQIGVTGSGQTATLGGVGRKPSADEVLRAVTTMLSAG